MNNFTQVEIVAIYNYHGCKGQAIWLHEAFSLLPHVVILLFKAVGPRVFILSFLPLVVDAVHRVEVPLDGVPDGDPPLADQAHHHDEEQDEDTRQGGKTDDHIE